MKLPATNPNDLKTGQGFLEEPGKFHVLVENVKVGLNSKDEPMDGTTVSLIVLAGTVAGCAQKTVNITLWHVDESKTTEEQKRTITTLWNFYIATNVVTPAQIAAGAEFDEMLAMRQQLIVHLSRKQKKVVENGKTKWVDDLSAKFLQIAYSDLWHIDDPAAANVPKNADSLDFISPTLRHDKSWFSSDNGGSASGKSLQTASKSSDYANDEEF